MTDTSSTPAPTPAPAPARKRSWGRYVFRTIVVLLVLIVLAVGILFLSADSLVRAGVIHGGKYATDQETALQMAKLSFFGGSLDLSRLEIQNIQDPAKTYKEPKILTMESCNVVVQPGSLLTNTVVINSIDIRGLEITLEQNGLKNNLSDLIEIIKKKTPSAASGSSQQASTKSDAPGRQLKIEKLRMTGTKVHLRGLAKLDLDLGPIAIDEPTNPDGRPMKIADLVAKILIHVAQQIVDNPQIPGDFKNGMKNVTALVDNMRKDLEKGLKDVSKSVQDLGKGLQDAGKSLQDATKGLQDAGKSVQDATKGLQDLFGGNKPPATKP